MYYVLAAFFISTVVAKHFLGQNSEQRRAPSDLDQSSMLKVICNQRDRFRARLRETEEVCLNNPLKDTNPPIFRCMLFNLPNQRIQHCARK